MQANYFEVALSTNNKTEIVCFWCVEQGHKSITCPKESGKEDKRVKRSSEKLVQ